MSSWFERGRPALLEGLSSILERIDVELKQELQERDEKAHESLLQEIETLKSTLRDVQNENSSLKAALRGASPRERSPGRVSLDNTQIQRAPSTSHKETQTASQLDSAADDADWKLEYKRVWSRYNKTSKQLSLYTARAKTFRDHAMKWEQYALSLEKKYGVPQELAPTAADHAAALTTAALSNISANQKSRDEGNPTNQARSSSPSISFISNLNPEEPVGVLDTAPDRGTRHRRAATTPPPALQTSETSLSTQSAGDAAPEEPINEPELPPLRRQLSFTSTLHIKQEPSSDIPVVISERSVRKRKRSDEEEIRKATRVKSEKSSGSSPRVTTTSVFFSPFESLDLDAAPRVETPRKTRQRVHRLSRMGSSIYKDTSELGAGEGLRRPDAQPLDLYTSPEEESDLEPLAVPAKTPTAKLYDQRKHPERQEPHQTPVSAQGTSEEGRLEALLNGHVTPPDHNTVLVRPTRNLREINRPVLGVLDMNVPRRELPFGDLVSKSAKVTPRAAQGGLATPVTATRSLGTRVNQKTTESPADKRGRGRLRRLPVSRLHLHDFKVNPDFNDGVNYAYSDVVRGRSDRAKLPGCTDENCCGKNFRAMALNERDAFGPALLQQPANIKVLEDFLGDDAYRLGSMTRQEKEELWVDAKVRDLANRFGRHKHRYARAPSPAALWNVDMPNTQEFEKEKEEMQQAVRKQVEERHRDAMRGNGEWLFRDE